MGKQGMGLRDIPLDNEDEELLGLSEYADALTTFIEQCDTPMTIALQGDWGSGKTSLMNLVRRSLLAGGEGRVQTVWFNTWQYSQFAMADSLALSMISHFIDEVGRTGAKSAKEALGKIWRGLKLGAAVAVGRVVGDQDAGREAITIMEGGAADPAMGLKDLKSELEQMVMGREDADRFVVFIDDLDRLVPSRAVELLESLKLFLDIPKCVFVLACDYQVVVQGLKQKFAVSEAELKGKSFFDKIIQVPFNMPLTQYQVHNYFDGLLDRIGVPHTDDDVKDYVELVNYSVGFNPRSMKRLFNTLLLLRLVADRKKVLQTIQEHAQESETAKILFAILCMQSAYDGLYRFMTRSEVIDDALFGKLRVDDALAKDETLADLRRELGDRQDQSFYRKLALFVDAFYSAIQLASDQQDAAADKLSEEESKTLRRIMNFSAVVSTEQAGVEFDYDERQYNRALGKEIAERLNVTFSTEIGELRGSLDRGGFYMTQPRKSSEVEICLYSSKYDFSASVILGADRIEGVLYCYYKSAVPEFIEWARAHLGERFSEMTTNEDDKTFATLTRVTLSGTDDWRARGEKLENVAKEVFGKFVPVFREAHRNPDALLKASVGE